MKRKLVYLSIAILTFIVGLYTVLTVSNSTGHFWRKLSGLKITSNGQVIHDASVYQHGPDGSVLMYLGEGRGWYIWRAGVQNIGSCNSITYIPFPRYIYAEDCDGQFCPCTEMGTAKIEIEAQLKMEQTSFEFNSTNRERIRISW